MRSSYSQPCFITQAGGVRTRRSLDDIHMNPLFVRRTAPQSNAEQDRGPAPRICVHLSRSERDLWLFYAGVLAAPRGIAVLAQRTGPRRVILSF